MNVSLENYAYGGAWAEPTFDSWLIIPFGLDMQVNFYLVSAAVDFKKSDHLYVIWIGGNDYINGRSDIEYATSNTVASIKEQVEWLLFYGAKHIVIANLPDVGVTPEAVSRGRDFATAASKMSLMHNRKLATMVKEEQRKYPKADIIFIDVKDYFDDLITHPDKYALKNIKEACYTGGFLLQRDLAGNKEIEAAKEAKIDILNNAALKTAYLTSWGIEQNAEHCTNPDDYLFWDTIHPTRVVHSALANLTYEQLYAHGLRGQVK